MSRSQVTMKASSSALISFSVPIGRERNVWMGPFGRCLQIIEPNGAGLGRRASDGLFAGITFEVTAMSAALVESGVER